MKIKKNILITIFILNILFAVCTNNYVSTFKNFIKEFVIILYTELYIEFKIR